MLVAMVVLTALLGLGAYTAVLVRKGVSQVAHDKHQQTALYAAESGLAAGIAYLRENYDEATHFGAHVSPQNDPPPSPSGIAGNGAEPGDAANPFEEETRAWYRVSVYNNVGDAGFSAGSDTDARVLLRSVGYGPRDSTVVLEVEVSPDGVVAASGRPCPGYAQRSVAEDGTGRNDCLETVEEEVQTYKPET